jgi:hypothetical protein
MLNILYLILALAAITVTAYYMFFYQVSIPGEQYHYTYALTAFAAAIIFSALWLARVINKDSSKTKLITE